MDRQSTVAESTSAVSPIEDAARVSELLRMYTDQRISFYLVSDGLWIDEINADTAKLQAELRSVIVHAAQTQPTLVVALAVLGMNDVLNSQGDA